MSAIMPAKRLQVTKYYYALQRVQTTHTKNLSYRSRTQRQQFRRDIDLR